MGVGDGFSCERPAWGPNDLFAYQRVEVAASLSRITLLSRTRGSKDCSLTGVDEDARHANWSAMGAQL